MMKLSYLLIIIVALLISCNPKNNDSLAENINHSLEVALHQSYLMARNLSDQEGRLPKTLDSEGNLETCNSDWWVSGFFPGQLWYLYEYFGQDSLQYWAEEYTSRVEDQQYTTDNHDVGFMIFNSFGNGYKITGNESYLPVIKNGSASLCTRYSDLIGCIKSWESRGPEKNWQFPVIIDNMMNLEMLLWAAEKFGIDSFRTIAITHAETTIRNHYRPDFSAYHVVSYDTITGEADLKHTAQGYAHESAWARGQAWGFYGFTMMYRMTRDSQYLDQANNIAHFLLNHPNLPEDKIPYWDFNAPDIPNALRDASAGAIICSALIDLSQYVGEAEKSLYLDVARKQLQTLSSPEYLTLPGSNGGFILKHGVGHFPGKSEVDVPLTYADYYFVEALLRYKKLFQKNGAN